ncbi:plasmid-related protein [Vibrio parahaemolyticus]|uniref:plasmid-related protein n=1 Tax=Vibrio parahaemolyticus TaxID=670 RepID=UPI00114057A5|nr:plasmid-related protein [Vibrio parahaemolyticus]MDF5244937.1 plasmid-related protein [Vibrio parahaemolyticus]MDF5407159.1 plasmid-related protein [Vibrio parahaemolyticus]MDF5678590.1 plasmid-related protein [Vibrio parahaemolyticus]MDG2690441.1 plasmid-related protein [Vibrio parahaemolyticus]MDG2822382.1 plasmid-related protein [Vibrio parahaemolyticus]
MEYIFGFIIQIAGIMLLAKLSWSLLRLLARQSVRPFRFVFTQIKRLLTPTPKRRPMAMPKAPGMPRLTSAFYKEPHQYDMALLEIPTYLRRQSSLPSRVEATVCTEFN